MDGPLDSRSLLINCLCLVGSYIPDQVDDRLYLHLESTGVLTHADGLEDEREWFRCFLYADDELVLAAATAPDAGWEVLTSGRLCSSVGTTRLATSPGTTTATTSRP